METITKGGQITQEETHNTAQEEVAVEVQVMTSQAVAVLEISE